jgi:hypothetical protein
MSDVAGIIRAVLEGAVTAASAATGLSKAQSREALLAELGELRATPPRPVDVDVAELDAAFERGRATSSPATVIPRLRPDLLERVRADFDRVGFYVDDIEALNLPPRASSIVRALEHTAAAIAVEMTDDGLRHYALERLKRVAVLVVDNHPDVRVTEEPPPPPVEIDGEPHYVAGPLSYERIVELAGETGSPSVKWSMPDGRGGTLGPGHTLEAPAGAKITVAHTGNA